MTTSNVLYRKWRPQGFMDIVGQDSVVQTLRQAVRLGRVAHAYMLAGPRGTGKTSTARILAKALNCQSFAPGTPEAVAADGEPDNSCPFCLAVTEGRALDLIEMDAASNRGIDDMRSLQERVFGAGPAEGRCKVYIIDEAHMLTEFAFNALLKTLEEPAPWAYFVLCTTEPHKVPATIISRCQRFDLRRIPPRDVEARLAVICEAEGFAWEPDALRAIASATAGSLRDACNVLEQAALSYGNRVTLQAVEGLLGLIRDPRTLTLVQQALKGDLQGGLATISDAAANGVDRQAFHREIVGHLRMVLLLKSGVNEESDNPPETIDALRSAASEVPWDTLLRVVRLFGQVNLRTGDSLSTIPLELALIEGTTAPESAEPRSAEAPARSPQPATGRPSSAPSAPQPRTAPPPRTPAPAQPQARSEGPAAPADAPPTPPTPPAEPSFAAATPGSALGQPLEQSQWDAITRPLKRVRGNKFVLGSLLLDCQSRYTNGSSLVLVFKNAANRDRLREELEHPQARSAFGDAVQEALGEAYDLELLTADAIDGGVPAQRGHLVRAAVAMGARIIPEQEETK